MGITYSSGEEEQSLVNVLKVSHFLAGNANCAKHYGHDTLFLVFYLRLP